MHQQFVEHHTAIHLQGGQIHARVLIHSIKDFAGLVSSRLKYGTGNMTAVNIAGHTYDSATSIALPVWCEQARERRHEVNTAAVFHGSSQWLNVLGGLNHLQVIADPLYQSAGDRD